MKKLIALTLAAALVLTFSACGGKEDEKAASTAKPAASSSQKPKADIPPLPVGYQPGDRTIQLFEEDLNAAKGPVHMKLKMEMELEEGKAETVEMTVASKDGVSGSDFTSSMGHMGSLFKDGVSYTIIHDQKMAMSQSGEPEESPLDMAGREENYYRDKVTYTAGTETVNGVSCDYDEMTEPDGKVSRVYFLTGTDTWVYLREGDSLIEVLDYGRKPDESLLSIPAGYTVSDFGAMGGGAASGMEGMEIPGMAGMEGMELPEGFEMPEGYEQYLPEGFDMGNIPGMNP